MRVLGKKTSILEYQGRKEEKKGGIGCSPSFPPGAPFRLNVREMAHFISRRGYRKGRDGNSHTPANPTAGRPLDRNVEKYIAISIFETPCSCLAFAMPNKKRVYSQFRRQVGCFSPFPPFWWPKLNRAEEKRSPEFNFPPSYRELAFLQRPNSRVSRFSLFPFPPPPPSPSCPI